MKVRLGGQLPEHTSVSKAYLFPISGFVRVSLLNDVELLGERALEGLDLVEFFELLINQSVKVDWFILLEKINASLKFSLKLFVFDLVPMLQIVEKVWVIQ